MRSLSAQIVPRTHSTTDLLTENTLAPIVQASLYNSFMMCVGKSIPSQYCFFLGNNGLMQEVISDHRSLAFKMGRGF